MCVPHLGIFRGITLRQVETLKTKVGEKNMLKTISGVFKYPIFSCSIYQHWTWNNVVERHA